MTDETPCQIESPVIRVRELYKCYWVGPIAFPAVNGIDLEVETAEIVVLAGRSGSGKSTLLHLLGGLEAADHGTIEVCDRKFHRESADALATFRLEHIGFVFQVYNLIRVLSARENIAYVCRLQGQRRRECLESADAWLAEVGMADLRHRRPDQLSGGQQQRVAVARALATHPDIVLADEPTANLDTHTARGLIDLLRALNERHRTTFVIASHDPDVIDSATRVVRLRDGRAADAPEGSAPLLPSDLACPHRPGLLGRLRGLLRPGPNGRE